MKSATIIAAVDSVTKKWKKQRKAEERGRARSRRETFTRSSRVTIKDAAWKVLPEAYLKASTNNALPAAARQVYYAARGPILKLTSRAELNSHYFTQQILPEYVAAHARETENWDITYDARGHFAEPHTEIIVPLGTLDVGYFLTKVREFEVGAITEEQFRKSMTFPTYGPEHRFSAVLFIEKEGFLPLFEAVKLAER